MGHVYIQKVREQNDTIPYHLPRYLTPCMSTLFRDKSRTVMVVTIVSDCRISRVPDLLILQYLSLSPTIALVLTKAVAVQKVRSRIRQYHWTGQYWSWKMMNTNQVKSICFDFPCPVQQRLKCQLDYSIWTACIVCANYNPFPLAQLVHLCIQPIITTVSSYP